MEVMPMQWLTRKNLTAESGIVDAVERLGCAANNGVACGAKGCNEMGGKFALTKCEALRARRTTPKGANTE
jgi:hypothetical protein